MVGAGILGTATAKYLSEELPDKSILLLDKFSGAGQGNTGKSNACYRNVFDTKLNIQLCNASLSYYKDIESDGCDLGLKEVGYLWLLTEDQFKLRKRESIRNPNNKGDLISFF